jgi:hypothetical protein
MADDPNSNGRNAIIPASGLNYEALCIDGPDAKLSAGRKVIAFRIPLEADGRAGHPRPITVLGEPRDYLLRFRTANRNSGGIDQNDVKFGSSAEFVRNRRGE